jgi:hypothetical protein
MVSTRLECDYLIVGAGAAGMAIADELLTHSDGTIAIVDRRSAPGGHWQEAYSFVRLHQPSAFYGVSSLPLGGDRIDEHGTNSGFYELAGVDEILAYYKRVMHTRFLPSGRLHWFPSCHYSGEGRIVSRLTGQTTTVAARRRLIDTTYMEGEFPATTPPPFEVADGVRCVPAGALTEVSETPERYVIIGAGKTALDTCVYLLEHGVAPGQICWIKSREMRWLNRRFVQPLTLLPETYRGSALQFEAIAESTSIEEVFNRLEAAEVFLRVDPNETATALRGAVISESELELLRRIEDIVRLGHVQRICPDRIVLDHGTVPTTPDSLHVHCAARGLAKRPLRPIFDGCRITVQPILWGMACYQFAFLGVVEAMLDDDEQKNSLCRPIHYWDTDTDYLSAFLARLTVDRAAANHTEVARWMKTTRLNPASGIDAGHADPTLANALERVSRHAPAAADNLHKLLAS